MIKPPRSHLNSFGKKADDRSQEFRSELRSMTRILFEKKETTASKIIPIGKSSRLSKKFTVNLFFLGGDDSIEGVQFIPFSNSRLPKILGLKFSSVPFLEDEPLAP